MRFPGLRLCTPGGRIAFGLKRLRIDGVGGWCTQRRSKVREACVCASAWSAAAELVAARRAGREPRASALLTPNVTDGARGLAFIEAAVASSRNDGAWTVPDIG